MKVPNTSDVPVTDAGCKKATGQTLKEWFTEPDKIDGLKQGRRASTPHIYRVRGQDRCLINAMASRIQTRPESDGLRNAWADALDRLKSL